MHTGNNDVIAMQEIKQLAKEIQSLNSQELIDRIQQSDWETIL